MSQLSIELHPLRPAVRRDAPVTLALLIRIVPPAINSATALRPPLNLALVLDHSGSMAGNQKIGFARQAAAFAVEQLLPTDRVSVTIFDDEVETILPSTPAEHKAAIIARISAVQPRNSTALHAGWQEGGRQVQQHLMPEGLNRVLLLTDGLANVGVTTSDAICTDVKSLANQGVSTTTLGVGRDYNEDLLEAMARSGDGNYYFIESPVQLADTFQTEMMGLMATVGRALVLELRPGEGVVVADVLNDLSHDPAGRLLLPNLILGIPLEVVVCLNVPPRNLANDLLDLTLTWTHPQDGPQCSQARLSMPTVGEVEWNALAADVTVQERAALQLAGRYKREASRFLERGDEEGARPWLAQARQVLAGLPRTADLDQEDQDLAALDARLEAADYDSCTKMAKSQHYSRSHTRSRTQFPKT
jgi:Ca-activated chloride channel family protein